MSDISFFFKPTSIAIIGASSSEGKVGYTVLKNVVDTFEGKIYPINPKAVEILGLKVYKSVLDVPGKIDIAVFVIPARFVNSVAEDCGKKKVKGLIVITAGFKEIGGKGVALEEELKRIGKKYKMRILGPNVLGFLGLAYNASFASTAPKKGKIAMISQSGAMLTGFLDYSLTQAFGFSYNISLGNKADLGVVDFIEYLADDEDTDVILCYLENITDGKRFFEVMPKAARKKPIVILKSGVSAAGARAASSHTGALAGSDIAYDLAFKKCGIIRAQTIEDLFDFGEIFLYQPIPKSNSFAIVTNAGGPGIVATDSFAREGLKFAEFSETVLHQLREKLPAEAAIFNPIDIIGDAPPDRYKITLETIFGVNNDDGDTSHNDENGIITTDGALVIVSPQAITNPYDVAKIVYKICSSKYLKNKKPVVCSFIGDKSMSKSLKYLRKRRIPAYRFPDRASKSLCTLVKRGEYLRKPSFDDIEIPTFKVNKKRVGEIFKLVKEDNRSVLLSSETCEIFECYDIIAPKSRLAQTPKQAFKYQKIIAGDGGKTVMKIVSPQIIHKTDVGGIKLNVSSEQESFENFIRILDSAKRFGPPTAKIYGVEVQEMIDFKKEKKVNELILGMSRDDVWGPMLMIGSGGIYANFIKDVSFALAYKFSEEDARNFLKKTKIYSLLQGVRGERSSDIESIINVVLKLSQLVNDFPEIVELDINPLLAFVKGYSAVDIKITISH